MVCSGKQNKTKQNKTKQNKTKQNKTKQNKTKQNKTKQTLSQMTERVQERRVRQERSWLAGGPLLRAPTIRRTTDTFLFISHTTNVLLFKFRCNIFIGVRIIKEMPGSVASETPCIYIYRFQNVFLRCPTPRLHCFLSSHWPSFRFLSFVAFLIPSIQYFLRSSLCSLLFRHPVQ